MNYLARYVTRYSQRARSKRASLFRQEFVIHSDTKVLDLGSETGEHIANVLTETNFIPRNIYIADIDSGAVAEGARRFGFTPVVIDESGKLPFPDQFFDIVYCSSVIEHVTISKNVVWQIRSGRKFKKMSTEAQTRFSQEINRIGKQYYVQTPNKWFPIESHSWLPVVGWLPRRLQVPLLRFTNLFWIKKAVPDWNLLGARDLSILFENSQVEKEKIFGLVKSVTALKKIANSSFS